MNFDQGRFDFEHPGSEEGYRHWRERLDAERRAFEKRWGVILGRRVRLQLRDYDPPVEGCLTLVERGSKGTSTVPRFCLGTLEFTAAEIESVVAMQDPD